MSPYNGQEMDDLTRAPSTETQRRNGCIQSKALDRSDRIIEDIRNEIYICSVCLDPVKNGTLPINEMWHCSTCFTVNHVKCVRELATRDEHSFTLWPRWSCPNCNASQIDFPRAQCWCGKRATPTLNLYTPNSCDNDCKKQGLCSHRKPSICSKICHAGPCKWACTQECLQTGPLQTGPPKTEPSEPTRRQQAADRFRARERGTMTSIFFTLAALLGYNITSLIMIIYNNRWQTQPYNYLDHDSRGSIEGVVIFLIIITFLLAFIPAMMLSDQLKNLASIVWDIRRDRMPNRITFPINILPLCLALWPLIIFFVLPPVTWHNNMRQSCDGFQTRVVMDSSPTFITRKNEDNQRLGSIRKAGTMFEMHSLDLPGKTHLFYLGTQITPIPESLQPFQYYERFSSSSKSGPHVAVDIDISNHSWRLMNLSASDDANRWRAYDSLSPVKESPTQVPVFKKIEETLIMNGSYSDFSKKSPHLIISELQLQMAYMYETIKHCTNEPFLRVFNTTGKNETEMYQQVKKRWSNKADEEVVMRTASFGHGRGDLAMCIKENSEGSSGSRVTSEMLVPFAIFAALRKRQVELGLGYSC